MDGIATSDFLDRLARIVGDRWVLTDPAAMAPHLQEDRGLYRGAARAVVKPGSTEEVAAVMRACAEAQVPIVPQGGNTGLCGGNVPFEHGREVVLSTARLNRIRLVDPIDFTMVAEAGCILADIQKAAAEAGCLFPLSLGAEGTCQIGGNLSTNAGGINVLRYGNARDQALGLEVVLPDGRIWNGLRRLQKDNTGYALRHLFIGAEGTLGIITAAALKLFPKPVEKQTAFCALADLDGVTRLLALARARSGDMVTGFELIAKVGVEFLARHIPGAANPLSEPHDWNVLIELSTSRPNSDLRGIFEALLEEAFEQGIIVDAVVAESIEQERALWKLRESLPESQKHEGGSIKHDVSVPVSRVPAFIRRASEAVIAAMPGARPCPFGHVGDGNIHFNISQPPAMEKQAFLDRWEEINRVVHDIVVELDGSISAEHGIGRLKVEENVHYKQPLEIELMQRLKLAFDPLGLMNPGKVLPPT